MTPAWMARLQAACDAHGMRVVGRTLGRSPTTLSLVLRGKYMASTDRLQQLVATRLPAPQEPDWLAALRADCEATNQELAGDRCGMSPATVSQLLSGTYAAATTRMERRVRGELLGATCACPVMGEVSTRVCQDVQERKPPIANPQHAQAWFACRGRGAFTRAGACPHFNGAGMKPAKE